MLIVPTLRGHDQTNGISRRRFLQGLAMASVGAALSTCAPAAPSDISNGAAPNPELITVSFWVFWSQKIADQLLATPELEERMGGNRLDFKTGIAQDARLTAIAGGTPPDIGILGFYQEFMSRGIVVPLDDYIEASEIISPDKFIPGNWEAIQYQGIVYGIPAFECFVRRGLGYNARMVAEAGLDPETPPITWDELLVWHEALTTFDDNGNLLTIGLDPYDAEGGVGPGNDGWFLPESFGFAYFNEDTQEFNLDNDRMAQGLETMGEFVKIIGPDKLEGMREVEGQGRWGGAFNAEVQAMIIEGYWHPGRTAHEKPDVSEVLRTTWVPVSEDLRGTKIQFGGGHMAMIFKEGNYQEEAWPVAEWCQTQTMNDLLFENMGWLPAYKPYLAKADTDTFPGLQFYFDSVNEATYWGPCIYNEIQAFIGEKYQRMREAVYRGELTGSEAAAKMQEEALKEWEAAGFG